MELDAQIRTRTGKQLLEMSRLAADYDLSPLAVGCAQLAERLPRAFSEKVPRRHGPGASLSRDFRRLLTTGKFLSDVTVAGKNESASAGLACHRVILAARNPYFRAMFYHGGRSLRASSRVVLDYNPK